MKSAAVSLIHFYATKIILLPKLKFLVCSGGFNHLPYILSISISVAVINDFSTNLRKDESSIYFVKIK